MASEAAFEKARADYRAGVSLASICKKHGISMREILKRIKDEGWLRASAEKKQSKALSTTRESDQSSKMDAAIDEAVADIIAGHRSISREMRVNLEEEIAEYQEIKQYFVSALDKDHIQELMRAGIEGKPNKALVDYLNDCLIAFGKRVQSLDKLVRLSTLLVTTERTVWGIESTPEGSGTESYDDLLEQCQAPLPNRALPEGVADFEQKLREQRSK